MEKISFDVLGSIKVDGRFLSVVKKDRCVVEINGRLLTSGCGDAAIVRSIGLDNIKSAVDQDEFLSLYSADELIDHIINSDRSDIAVQGIADQLIRSFEKLE